MKPEAPLLTDPLYAGAADPTIFWNYQENQWWIVYTQRMHTAPGGGFSPIHGSALGIASSPDGHDWLYRGTLEGLAIEPGHNTFWAPEILWHTDRYHMYVSYVQGIPTTWARPRDILHYTSLDGWHWHFESRLLLSSHKVIDACVAPAPEGGWRMWYKDELNDSHTYSAVSKDLYHWNVEGCVLDGDGHEGPNVFFWQGSWWLIADYWKGLRVFKSDDQKAWKPAGLILDQSGTRRLDQGVGNHADVLVQGDEAYVFYFTSEAVPKVESDAYYFQFPRTAVQVGRLHVREEELVCSRDEVFDFLLMPEHME